MIPRSIRLGVSLSLQASKMGAISSKSVTSIVKRLKRDTLLRIAFETWAWMSLSCIQTELKVTLNRAGADLSKNTRGSYGSMGIWMSVHNSGQSMLSTLQCRQTFDRLYVGHWKLILPHRNCPAEQSTEDTVWEG